MLQKALAMSMESGGLTNLPSTGGTSKTASAALPSMAMPDFSTMTEEEQIAYAMQISMQECRKFFTNDLINWKQKLKFSFLINSYLGIFTEKDEPMDVDQPKDKAAAKKPVDDQDFSTVRFNSIY